MVRCALRDVRTKPYVSNNSVHSPYEVLNANQPVDPQQSATTEVRRQVENFPKMHLSQASDCIDKYFWRILRSLPRQGNCSCVGVSPSAACRFKYSWRIPISGSSNVIVLVGAFWFLSTIAHAPVALSQRQWVTRSPDHCVSPLFHPHHQKFQCQKDKGK